MRIIALIIISCMFAGCNIPFTQKAPNTWSTLLKSSPKKMQVSQAKLKIAMAKLKK